MSLIHPSPWTVPLNLLIIRADFIELLNEWADGNVGDGGQKGILMMIDCLIWADESDYDIQMKVCG
jgi:hypothetical protein